MASVTDQDGNVAQVTPDGRLYVTIDGSIVATDVYIKRQSDGARVNPSSEETLQLVLAAVDTLEPKLSTDLAFQNLLKFQPAVGYELRAEDLTTDRYHGTAPDNTSTASATWSVVRFYKDASGNITRVRYKTGIKWDDRALAGNWP